MIAHPFSPAEHYAFSTGLCHAFAAAAQTRLGGVPTVLVATDPRQLAQHDHPLDEPLALHVFLQMPDGTVVDGEGRRHLEALLSGFGVRKDFEHDLVPDPDLRRTVAEFGTPSPAWVALLGQRLAEQGWTAAAVPDATGTLARGADYRAAQDAWEATGWPAYQAKLAALVAPPAPRLGRSRRP